MSLRAVVGVLGFLLLITAASLLAPAAAALLEGDGRPAAWLLPALGGAGLGLAAMGYGRGARDIGVREGFAVVTLGWLACSLLGAAPLVLCGDVTSYTDAVFETVSGFTTTGASILPRVEDCSRATLLWRALTHWLGGMGIVLLAVAVLPLLGVGGMQLYRAEVPGPVPDRLTPRVRDTARRLWAIYAMLTGAEILALVLAGMGAFDATCHAFATLATGGFSTRNASLGAYGSPAMEWIVIAFMFLAGCNFSLHYLALTGRPGAFRRDEEWRFYLATTLAAAGLVALALIPTGLFPRVEPLVRASLFQVVSVVTTTGFATSDFALWPVATQVVLLVLMCVGGCAGSTGGGIKVMRVVVLLKQAKLELKRLVHPRAVYTLWYNGRPLPPGLPANVLGFFLFFVLIGIASVLVLALGGHDLVTATGAVAACLGNVGPGLGAVGPAGNYAHLAAWEKWVLAFCMLVGRLEIYTVLVLFLPDAWRRA